MWFKCLKSISLAGLLFASPLWGKESSTDDIRCKLVAIACAHNPAAPPNDYSWLQDCVKSSNCPITGIQPYLK